MHLSIPPVMCEESRWPSLQTVTLMNLVSGSSSFSLLCDLRLDLAVVSDECEARWQTVQIPFVEVALATCEYDS